MKHYFYKLSLVLYILSLTACVKNTDKDIGPAPTSGTLNLHLHTMLDSLEIETLDSAYKLASGKIISVSSAQLYLSNVRLVKADGSEVVVDGKPILVSTKQERYNVGQADAGNYVSVKFYVGLSAALNASEPSATDSVLSNPMMWFGKSVKPDGYIFLKFVGKTSASGSSPLKDFKYDLGTNDNLVTVHTNPKNIAIIPKNVTFVHLNVNYAKLLEGVDVSEAEVLYVDSPFLNNNATAKRMIQNIPLMFEYEE